MESTFFIIARTGEKDAPAGLIGVTRMAFVAFVDDGTVTFERNDAIVRPLSPSR